MNPAEKVEKTMIPERKARIGLLMIASPRFRTLGAGTGRGTYDARKREEEAAYLGAFSAAGEVVSAGIVYGREDLGNAIDLFVSRKVDCVAALYLSWAEDFAWVRFLRDMPPVPIFFCSVVHSELKIGNTDEEDNFVEFLADGGLVGSQEASGSLRRFGRPMTEIRVGTVPRLAEELTVFAKAALARNLLRQSTMGLLACYNEVMWSTYVDPYDVFMKLGPELRFLSVSQLADKIEAVSAEKVKKTVSFLCSRFPQHPGVDPEKMDASVRASIAMEELAADFGLDLLVLNDVDHVLFEKVGLRPGFVPTNPESRLCVVPEGDIGGGAATYLLQLLGGKPANFIEPFYIDRKNGTFFAGHAGPNNYWNAPGNTVIANDARFAKTGYRYAGAPFAWYVFPAGLKTMLHISECGGKFKMVCTLAEALPGDHTLASYSHGVFRHPRLSPEELFGKALEIGVTQHYAITDGDHLAELEALASLMDFDFYAL